MFFVGEGVRIILRPSISVYYGVFTWVKSYNAYGRFLFLQSTVNSPVKSARLVPPSPQKTELPQPRLAQAVPSPVSSPLKIYSSTQPSSPLKSLTASPSSPHRGYISQSPLKNQGPSKLNSGATLNSNPAKPMLTPKLSSTADAAVVPQGHERFTKDTTPLQHKGPAGTPGQWGFSSARCCLN